MDKVTVIQADRDAAQAAMERLTAYRGTACRDGETDNHWLVQQFAKHRLATSAPDSEKLREALKLGADQLLAIKQANDPDDADSYRSDDREGCLDFTFAAADEAEKALRAALGASA